MNVTPFRTAEQSLSLLYRVACRLRDDYAALGLIHNRMQTIRYPDDRLAAEELQAWRQS